jgi:hypothetical protein
MAVLALRHHREPNCSKSVVDFFLHIVVEDRALESGESVGIGTVHCKLGEFTGHGWTSQSNGVEDGLDLRVKRKQPSTTSAAFNN